MRSLNLLYWEIYKLVSKFMLHLDSQPVVPRTGDIGLCHLPSVHAAQLEHDGRWVIVSGPIARVAMAE